MATITIIVPIYKVEKYIHRCIGSILGQTFQDFDLVLVDDGSPDACPKICDEYAEKDARIKVIHKQNGGLSDARNAGIDWAMEQSDSEWLAFVDSDDYLHADYLKNLYDTAKKESADLVICDFARVNEREEIVEEEHRFFHLVTEDKERMFECLRSNWRVVTAWNKLYHKHIFRELRFETGKIHEDSFAVHHVLWNCRRAAFIPEELYYYRLRNESIMASESPGSKLDGMEAFARQREFGLEHHIAALADDMPIEYLRSLADTRPQFDSGEKQRYRQLKKRLAKVYFACGKMQSPKRWFGFHFPGVYCRLASLFHAEEQRYETEEN